ncbi:MAG: Crp/Fnr family transcriptional regulator [Bacteroidota bacterium]|nr:Crp/Fnr family transcriptional regulator [Candidatus Kapabacteria bacterium]MDW8219829.1 Crp/Fnr family transcriptional regulator [Bacteroidota bacterium]
MPIDLNSSIIDQLPFLRLIPTTVSLLPAGTPVFTEGSNCGKIGFVQRGVIRVFKLSETGREITLYRLYAGESCVLSMSCALSHPIHQASAVVEEEAEILTTTIHDFQLLMERSHEARNYVFSQFASRLTDIMLLVEEVVFQRVDVRLAALLADLARHSSVIAKTHQELAIELGTAREVVSRILKDFEHRGLVRLSRGTITVAQPRKLLQVHAR